MTCTKPSDHVDKIVAKHCRLAVVWLAGRQFALSGDMAVAEETVVFAREGEALLQYPDSLRVRLAEKSFGKPAVPPKKAKVK